MSAYIPLELQDEIIKRLPAKSLLRFRTVSQRWRALIDSSAFITDYTVNQNQPHHLLINDGKRSHVSIVDDDSFPHSKFYPTFEPFSDDSFNSFILIVGWSHGLVCLCNPDSYRSKYVIWNPSIRKSVAIDYLSAPYALGFGVCPKTFDIKIVNLMCRSESHYEEAEVFTLRLGAWRSISMVLPRKPQSVANDAVVIDGVIHWLVFEYVTKNGKCGVCNQKDHWILSFDLKSEEFREVYLPDSLAGSRDLDIYKRNNSLVILDYGKYGVCDVWMMCENGVSSFSFVKLFTVKAHPYTIIGFRKNGQLILKHWYQEEFQAYDPDLKHMYGLGTTGMLFKLASYTESLLLLNHSDASNDDHDKNIYGTHNNYAAGPSTVK